MRPYVIEEDLWVKLGDKVDTFKGANNALGTLVLKFSSHEEFENIVNNPSKWLKIEVV